MLHSYAVLSRPDSSHTASTSKTTTTLMYALRRCGYKVYPLVFLLPHFIRTLVVQFTKKERRMVHGSASSKRMNASVDDLSYCSANTKPLLAFHKICSTIVMGVAQIHYHPIHVLRTTRNEQCRASWLFCAIWTTLG